MKRGKQPVSKHYDVGICSFLFASKEKLGKLRKLTDQTAGCTTKWDWRVQRRPGSWPLERPM